MTEQTMEERFDKEFDETNKQLYSQYGEALNLRKVKEFINSERDLALKSQQESLVEEIKKHCYESEEKEQDFCALQGRIGLRNEIIEIIKKIYEQN